MIERVSYAFPEAASGPGLRVHYAAKWSKPPQSGAVNPFWTASWFALLQCGRDGGELENDAGARCRLAPGDVWMLFPGVRHRYGPVAGGWWVERILAFDGWLPRRLLDEGRLDLRRPLLTPTDPDSASVCFDAALAAAAAARPADAVPWAYTLLHRCTAPPPVPADHPLQDLAERMRREPQRDWDLHAESTALGMRYHHLRQEFRRRLGLPPQQWLIARRIDRLAERLAAGNTLAAATRTSGFSDPAYAARQFRRLRGQTPGSFVRAITA